MKAHRGQSLPLHSTHHKPGAPRASLGRLCWASVGPFLAAALIGSVLFRATGSGTGAEEVVVQRPSSRVLEETGRPIPCLGLNCGGHGAQTAATGAGAEGGRAAVIVGSSLGGSSSSEVGGGSGEQLPQLFLFIGILSGRGYRHRRLAVREAWSNKAQVPGQVVARFILSEDERTPQVGWARQAARQNSLLLQAVGSSRWAVWHACRHHARASFAAPRPPQPPLPSRAHVRRWRRSWRRTATLCLCGRRPTTSPSCTRHTM